MDHILPVEILSHKEIMLHIAQNFKRLRLDHFNWSRSLLASKSSVTESTIKRFENSGQITMENLVLLAVSMNVQEQLLGMFPLPETSSMAELEKRQKKRRRASARKS